MKNIITVFIAVSTLTASLAAHSACSIYLPIAELNDCIIVESTGDTYKSDRDHISTKSDTVEIIDITNPEDAYYKLSRKTVD